LFATNENVQEVDSRLTAAITALASAIQPFLVKTGTIETWSTNVCPAGYLECSGQAVSRATYAGLFNVLGISFGAGDGSTTFNLPDLRGSLFADGIMVALLIQGAVLVALRKQLQYSWVILPLLLVVLQLIQHR
jgi:hypothetical protein